MVTRKNETNVMVKNALDVILGGLSYWMFGFAFSFGHDDRSNLFSGVGYFFTDANEDEMGAVFAKYFFQLSFATTATTVVSGKCIFRENSRDFFFNWCKKMPSSVSRKNTHILSCILYSSFLYFTTNFTSM